MQERHATAAVKAAGDSQHLKALERANAIRLARAELKRLIAEGEVTVADVLTEVPAHAESWAVWDLLMCQRRWGTTRCRKFLARTAISETRQIGQLTERQRGVLIAELGRQGDRALALV